MTNSNPKFRPTDVLTPTFRASYLNVFDARAADESKPNDKVYGVEMWFRMAEKCDERLKDQPIVKLDDLVNAVQAAAAAKWGPDKNLWPKGLKSPFKKGEDLTGKNGTLDGGVMIRTKRKEKDGKPVIVDQDVKDIIDKTRVYSGCYMRAQLNAAAWVHPTGGKGVSFWLNMLQLVADGEPLGNKADAADAFGPIAVPTSSAQPTATAAASDVFGDLS